MVINQFISPMFTHMLYWYNVQVSHWNVLSVCGFSYFRTHRIQFMWFSAIIFCFLFIFVNQHFTQNVEIVTTYYWFIFYQGVLFYYRWTLELYAWFVKCLILFPLGDIIGFKGVLGAFAPKWASSRSGVKYADTNPQRMYPRRWKV